MNDFQYYPTGAHTAALMWAKFQRPIRHVCDPSAGGGHLLRHAEEGFPTLSDEQIPWLAHLFDESDTNDRLRQRTLHWARKKFSGIKQKSVVEIDPRHHDSLKRMGAKVLGYDFMDVSSLATVSHVIANPPFNAGCAHVLHAWDCAYDAEIVAIINASNIKNPYTQERKRLVELIERHGSCEFLQDQFTDEVDRKTDVEVALIYLEKVPGKYLDVGALLGDLAVGDNEMGEANPEVCSALALPSNFIQDTCYRFKQAVAAARNACETTAVADHFRGGLGITLEEMQAKGVGGDFRHASGNIRAAANESFQERYSDLKKRAWGQIIRSSLLTDKLSNQARKKLEASAESIYDFEFTAGNIHSFLRGVVESMGDIYREMILDLFDTIIERSSDNVVFYRSWKSNQKHRIGMRLRRTRFIIPRFRMGFGGSLDYEDERFLADIDKVWSYLLNNGQPYEGLVHGFRKNRPEDGQRIETKFFDFRFYRGAGTIHFYPRSVEVVEKINLFVGRLRNWIPGDMEEANKDFQAQYEKGESMTEEYLEGYKRSTRTSYGLDRPALRLMREIKGTDNEEGSLELDRLDRAIAEVHEAKGLRCGAALTAASPLVALPSPTAVGERASSGQPEQLQLLAA